jgi:hypothetical protein
MRPLYRMVLITSRKRQIMVRASISGISALAALAAPLKHLDPDHGH